MEKKKTQAFFEGRELEAYNLFGAHPKKTYTDFAVWAPHAQSVSVIGTFNDWDVEDAPMTKDDQGIWTARIKGAKPGHSYKYHVVQAGGDIVDKIDPFAFYSELRPQTASIIADLSFDGWTDQKWMKERTKGYDDPISIYEVHLGSWKRTEDMGPNDFPKYLDIVDDLIAHCKKYHFTHVEVMPLCEHPFDGSWGYQDTGYFSTTSRYGTNVELMEFVNKLHDAGIGIIMDFVPVHFVKDNFALARFDGTPLYEYQNPDDANSEWGTANFDLWKEEVRSFLMSAANYWLDVYHMDGLRWDAISNAIFWKGNKERGVNEGACDFMKRANFMINEKYHGKVMLIAEDSTDFPNVTKSTLDGGLGFDYKWDLGWMNDTLKYLKRDPIYRQYHHNDITFSMAYFYSERFILPFSHDEVVHGKATIVDKMWGSYEDKFAQCRALYTYMFTHPGKKLNFMGNEIGMLREWDEQKSTDWFLLEYPMHDAFAKFFADLTALYADNDAYYYGYDPLNFQWIDADDAGRNLYVFMRKATDKTFITILNFSTNPYRAQFGAPHKGVYTEVMNTQWAKYNGSLDTDTAQRVKAVRLKRNNQPFMIEVDVPALGAQIFEVDNEPETAKK
ncbi:1,4-alpha-glucan branching protein GlgB [uncultured Dubosiella sp.]|uniref:1,4-alpha-glucan branching protein GlgB n=2 Tax=uncultured Dubosiella sp. TaxID=1937011 RepID=UPI00258899DF|nr:1,4-alpha-glucan branching protein GlgB [uncultured Dubosiella sp.]